MHRDLQQEGKLQNRVADALVFPLPWLRQPMQSTSRIGQTRTEGLPFCIGARGREGHGVLKSRHESSRKTKDRRKMTAV